MLPDSTKRKAKSPGATERTSITSRSGATSSIRSACAVGADRHERAAVGRVGLDDLADDDRSEFAPEADGAVSPALDLLLLVRVSLVPLQ
jgi:hypothetical protein